MSTRFNQQVGIVTGAGSGIGFEIARQLVLEGAHVILNDIDSDQAERSAQEISRNGSGSCLSVAGDAGSVDTIETLVQTAVREFGQLDMVVANAGITLFGDFLDFTPADFRKIIDLNLQGAFFLTQAAVRQMKEQPGGGRILLISSNIGKRAYPYLTAYSMTKAALMMMARSLVLELSPYGININTLAPGATLTARTQLEDQEYEKTWSRLIPVGRVGSPRDMAASALFLLSDAARHITGQTLVVDGGWTGVGKHPEVVIKSQTEPPV